MYINQVDLLFDIVSELVLSLPKNKLIELVKRNKHSIVLMQNPPEDVVIFALKEEPELIEYINNPPEEAIEISIRANPELIQHVKNPPLRISLELIKKDIVKFLPLINNKDKDFYLEVLKLNPHNIQYIPREFLPNDIHLQSIRENPELLNTIPEEEQTEELCLEAVKLKGRCLRFVKRQNFNIIKTAIENDINAFKYLIPDVLTPEEIEEIRALMNYKKMELLIAKKLGPKNDS